MDKDYHKRCIEMLARRLEAGAADPMAALYFLAGALDDDRELANRLVAALDGMATVKRISRDCIPTTTLDWTGGRWQRWSDR